MVLIKSETLIFRREWCGQLVLTNGKRAKAVFTLYRIAFVPTRKIIRCSVDRNGTELEQNVHIIASRGDWLGNSANIKVENNSAVGYVGSSLTVHNPLFPVHKLWLHKLVQCFYWSVTSKWRNAIERCVWSCPKTRTKTYNKGSPNHST